ncbi:MAG: hypothetical protein NC389_17885, partial [Acetatifactor muris]|nr:hypothetical protein [Acetatifactor muris]
NIGCAIEMIRLHGNLQLALWQICSRLSVYGYALDSGETPEDEYPGGGDPEDAWWRDLAGAVFASAYIKAWLTDLAGEEYLNRSPLKNGTDSMQLWESEIFGGRDTIDLIVTYSVSPGAVLAGLSSFRMANRYYAHIWNGYRLAGADEESGGQVVFITENASVFHLDRDCTHLRLSVRQISASMLEEERNRYGRRYQACEKCVGEEEVMSCYITESGDRYHYVRECPGLKRTIFSISLEEAAGYQPCSRCGRKGE